VPSKMSRVGEIEPVNLYQAGRKQKSTFWSRVGPDCIMHHREKKGIGTEEFAGKGPDVGALS